MPITIYPRIKKSSTKGTVHQNAVDKAEAHEDRCKEAALKAKGRIFMALEMQRLAHGESEWIHYFLDKKKGTIFSENDIVAALGRTMLGEELSGKGAQLEVEARNQHNKAKAELNNASECVKRAKEALLLHKTRVPSKTRANKYSSKRSQRL